MDEPIGLNFYYGTWQGVLLGGFGMFLTYFIHLRWRDRNFTSLILLFLHDFSSISCGNYTDKLRGVSLDVRSDLLRSETWHHCCFDHHLGRRPRVECCSLLLTAYATLWLVARINYEISTLRMLYQQLFTPLKNSSFMLLQV